MSKKLLLLAVALLATVVSVQAQRRGCLHGGAPMRASSSNMLPEPYEFDAQKTYRVPVVLFSFSDLDFSMDNPAAYYDRLFNEKGFNEGVRTGQRGRLLPRSVGRPPEFVVRHLRPREN